MLAGAVAPRFPRAIQRVRTFPGVRIVLTDVLDPEEIEFVTDCYLPGRTNDERRAPEISPAFADLHRLPPLFMSVGTTDHLFDDTMLVATRAAAAGVEVELVVLPEMPHAFMAFPCTATKVWAERLNAWLERTLSSGPS